MESNNQEQEKSGNQHKKYGQQRELKRPHLLCMTGIEKQYVEKDLIRFMRKYLEVDAKPVPLHAVHKKRG